MKFTATVEIDDALVDRFRSTWKERERTRVELEELVAAGGQWTEEWITKKRAADEAHATFRAAQAALNFACAEADGSIFQQLDALMKNPEDT